MKKRDERKQTSDDGPQMFMPCGMATPYLSEHDGPYRRVVRFRKDIGQDWAYFYKGRKRVFDCSTVFSERHFYRIS